MENQPPKREPDEESEPDELDLMKILALRCQPEATSNGATKTKASETSYQGSTDVEDPTPCIKDPQTSANTDMNSPSKLPPKDKDQLSKPQTVNLDMGTNAIENTNEAALESNGEEQLQAVLAATYQEPMVGAYAVAPPPDQSTIEENQDDESESDEELAVTPHTSVAARLSVAIPVDENHERQAQSLPTAEEYNLDEQARMRTERKRKTHLIKATICISLGALIFAGFVLLIVYLLGLDEKVDQQEAHDGNTGHAFTSHNTTSNEIEAYVMALLPNKTIEAIRSKPGSPQARAAQWLLNDIPHWNHTDQRVLQRFALATFYYATGGDDWFENEGWLNHSLNDCKWFSTWKDPCYGTPGIMEFIREDLFLEDNNLQGSLPPEMFLLTHASIVGLAKNSLVGSIPSEIADLSDLKAFVLHENQLTGTVPPIEPFPRIMLVQLSDNQLNGTLPTKLQNLPLLFDFNVTGNALTGTLPTEFGLLEGMKNLWLSNNHFEGSIPAAMANLTLKEFAVDGNLLTGEIPYGMCEVDLLQFDCLELCGCNCSSNSCGGGTVR
ncbi:Leucine Rich Repeat [Seminavis robusta]|uniref:Leucine Rich Repeat n=1 Tax=Seminavis robusta TaxID=568900 RepID=A0A9N8DNM7_9STRA|nr:Leucine Rich Repeat [Seminavis robusta]|eukprot:Sro155_g070580.1 Leucine Rich Repeat (554) ;mRNA; r:101229-103066